MVLLLENFLLFLLHLLEFLQVDVDLLNGQLNTPSFEILSSHLLSLVRINHLSLSKLPRKVNSTAVHGFPLQLVLRFNLHFLDVFIHLLQVLSYLGGELNG